jgi:hypothetical protein
MLRLTAPGPAVVRIDFALSADGAFDSLLGESARCTK